MEARAATEAVPEAVPGGDALEARAATEAVLPGEGGQALRFLLRLLPVWKAPPDLMEAREATVDSSV